MKTIFLSWLAKREADRLRVQAINARRELRDHTRNELARACNLDNRARGLRLYAAWSQPVTERAPVPRGLAALIPGARATTTMPGRALRMIPRPERRMAA